MQPSINIELMKIIKNVFSLKSYSLTFCEMYLFAPLAKLDEKVNTSLNLVCLI